MVLFKWRRQSLVSEPGQNFVLDWILRILKWKFNLFKWIRQSLVSEPGHNCVLDWTSRILRWKATYNSTLSIGAFPFHIYQPRFFVDSGVYTSNFGCHKTSLIRGKDKTRNLKFAVYWVSKYQAHNIFGHQSNLWHNIPKKTLPQNLFIYKVINTCNFLTSCLKWQWQTCY